MSFCTFSLANGVSRLSDEKYGEPAYLGHSRYFAKRDEVVNSDWSRVFVDGDAAK